MHDLSNFDYFAIICYFCLDRIPLLQPSCAQSVGEAQYAEGVRDGSEPPEDDRQSGFNLAKLFFPDRRLLWPPAVVLATSSGLADSH